MRQWQGLLLGLLTGLLVGCTTAEPARTTSWLDRLRTIQPPTGTDVVQMQVALIEQRVGDPYLNEGLWILADEGIIPFERKQVLENNGFRIGQVGRVPQLQTLLTSERSCANPREMRLHTGDAKELLLGPVQPVCRFQLRQDGEAEAVALEQAQLMLVVVATQTRDGSIRLRFTPQVQHGETHLVPSPAPDHTGITLLPQRAMDHYATLSWEVTLSPSEYVVVGARYDRPGSLGFQAFVRADEAPPVQRLLVIHVNRTANPEGPDGSGSEPDALMQRSPPVASQASWTAARGTRP